MAKRGLDGGDVSAQLDEIVTLGGQILQALISLAGVNSASSSIASSTGTIANSEGGGGFGASAAGAALGARVGSISSVAAAGAGAFLGGAAAGVSVADASGGFAALRMSLLGGEDFQTNTGAGLLSLANNLPSTFASRTQMVAAASQAAYGDVASFADSAAELGIKLSRDELKPFFDRRFETRTIAGDSRLELQKVQGESAYGNVTAALGEDFNALRKAVSGSVTALELLPAVIKSLTGGLGYR